MATILHHYLLPPIALVVAPMAIQYMVHLAKEEGMGEFSFEMLLGNPYAWMVILLLLSFEAAFLMIPFDKYSGRTTSFGTTPEYTDNGVGVYITTAGSYIGFHLMWMQQSMYIYNNFVCIMGAANMLALGLSAYLWYLGKRNPQSREMIVARPILSEICHGVELHPRIMDFFDVKQLIITRMGFLSWQILVIAFFYAFWQMYGFNWGIFVNMLLQSYYIYIFMSRESAFMLSVDITEHRPGYYLLWSSLLFIPMMHSFSTYYFVTHAPTPSFMPNLGIALLGSACILVKIKIEAQKDLFKATNGRCVIWGKKASYVEDTRDVKEGCLKPRLLTSGYWGMSRHLNYVFDILCGICWCLPGITLGVYPFLYCLYLAVFLLFRVSKVEARCAEKYGSLWTEYCAVVRYKFIPYVY